MYLFYVLEYLFGCCWCVDGGLCVVVGEVGYGVFDCVLD